jgi:hypothetical protein
MKKKIFIGFAALAVAAVAAWNVYLASTQGNELSELMLENLEALAQDGEIFQRPCETQLTYYDDYYNRCGFGTEMIGGVMKIYSCIGSGSGSCYPGHVFLLYGVCSPTLVEYNDDRWWDSCE